MKSRIILAAMLCVALSACKKKTEEPAPKEQIKLLSKVTISTDNGVVGTVNYTYDDKNRLIQKNDHTYIYTGDDLTGMTFGTGTAATTYTIKYNNGVPVTMNLKAEHLNDNYTYTMAGGNVESIKRTDGYGYKFTYSGHNVVKATSTNSAAFYVFEYGLNKNPYYNPTCKYVLLPLGFDTDDYAFNQSQMSDTYYQQYPFLGAQYSYINGSDGYPKTATVKTNPPNDPDSFIYKYLTFEYVMRDVVN